MEILTDLECDANVFAQRWRDMFGDQVLGRVELLVVRKVSDWLGGLFRSDLNASFAQGVAQNRGGKLCRRRNRESHGLRAAAQGNHSGNGNVERAVGPRDGIAGVVMHL